MTALSRFEQVQVARGKVRSGLEPGLSRPGRHRIWFHAWGTDAAGRPADKTDSFVSGSIYADSEPGAEGLRRAFDLSLCDRDGTNNLEVALERDPASHATHLLVRNPGQKGVSEVRVALGPVAVLEDVPNLLSGPDTRVVFLRTDRKDATGEEVTTLEVGPWANQVMRYTLTRGRLQSEQARQREWAQGLAHPAAGQDVRIHSDHVQVGAVRLKRRGSGAGDGG